MYDVIVRCFTLVGVALNAAPNSYSLMLLAFVASMIFPPGPVRLRQPRTAAMQANNTAEGTSGPA